MGDFIFRKRLDGSTNTPHFNDYTADGAIEEGDLVSITETIDTTDPAKVKKVADDGAEVFGLAMHDADDTDEVSVVPLMPDMLIEADYVSGACSGIGTKVGIDVTSTVQTVEEGLNNLHAVVYDIINATAPAKVLVYFPNAFGDNGANGASRMRAGSVTFTGSTSDNDTGLQTILFAFAAVKDTTQGAGDAAYVTVDHGADGNLDLYAWDDAGAAATSAATVYWFAVGA